MGGNSVKLGHPVIDVGFVLFLINSLVVYSLRNKEKILFEE